MHTKEEIEKTLRTQLPIIFGKKDAVDFVEFRKKYNELIDYALANTEPFLKAETVRYQSILLYTSLIFLSIKYLSILKIKIDSVEVEVSAKLLIAYSVFIGMVALIFLTKAMVDSRRARLLKEKNSDRISELKNLISAGWLKKTIQQHYWLKIFDEIGRASKVWQDEMAKINGRQPTLEILEMMKFQTLDLENLRGHPELVGEIEGQEKFYGELEIAIKKATERYVNQVQSYQKPAPPMDSFLEDSFSYARWEHATGAYNNHLKKWLEARNSLITEQVKHQFDDETGGAENRKFEAMLTVLKRSKWLQSVYTFLEIVMPLFFAGAVLGYVWTV